MNQILATIDAASIASLFILVPLLVIIGSAAVYFTRQDKKHRSACTLK